MIVMNCLIFLFQAVGHSLQGLKPNIQKDAVGDLAKKIGSCLNTENENIKQHANFASRALFSGVSTIFCDALNVF